MKSKTLVLILISTIILSFNSSAVETKSSISKAGQSNFSAELIKSIQLDLPQLNTSQCIHIVQHSDWNEKVTSPESLNFVKQNSDYRKISDRNAVGNSTPGFRSPEHNS